MTSTANTNTIHTIIYALTDDGAFMFGDTETGLSGYAYPTSPRADKAKKDAARTAREACRDMAALYNCGHRSAELTKYFARISASPNMGTTTPLPA